MDQDPNTDEQGRVLMFPPILGAPLISRNGQNHWPLDDGYIHAEFSQVQSLRVQGCVSKTDHEAAINDPLATKNAAEKEASDGPDVRALRKPKRV